MNGQSKDVSEDRNSERHEEPVDVDPRVQIELEKLNAATDDINKLEVDLDEARAEFRQLLCDSSVRINALAKKLGSCVEKARPYYEARIKAKEIMYPSSVPGLFSILEASDLATNKKQWTKFVNNGYGTEERNHAVVAAVGCEVASAIQRGTMTCVFMVIRCWESLLDSPVAPWRYIICVIGLKALHETQLAAIKFERANSAHAAAKEMVYLAEEGLCAEGRTFDHAWQEMLNHATMRVNESELERTISEAEHRRTSHCYQRAETNVQQLQKELKRSIAKSRPYFELKAQFNQILEEQKSRVKKLERRVGIAKASYAEALRNLEQISDEIHRIRKHGNEEQLGTRGSGVGAESPMAVPAVPSPDTRNTSAATLSSSTNADTDRWTDTTESSDSECGEEYLRLPEKLGPSGSPIIPKGSHDETSEKSEYLSLSGLSDAKHKSQSVRTSQNTQHSNVGAPGSQTSAMETSFIQQSQSQASKSYSLFSDSKSKYEKKNADSPEEENMIQSLFSKIVPAKLRQGSSNTSQNSPKASAKCEYTEQEITNLSTPSGRVMPYSFPDEQTTLSDEMSSRDIGNAETWSEVSLTSNKTSPESERIAGKSEVWTEVNLNDSSSPVSDLGDDADSRFTSVEETQSTPIRLKLDSSLSNWITRSSVDQGSNSRRQSLDTLILGGLATGERVKEILSQGIMKLNISSLTERRSSEPKVDKPGVRMNLSGVPVLSSAKKVPSPLEKSMNYLNPEDDSTSDSESLARMVQKSLDKWENKPLEIYKRKKLTPTKSVPNRLEQYIPANGKHFENKKHVEMLTDEQISSLMLEQDLQEVCQQVLGTPISEIAPYYTSSAVTQ